MDDLRARYGGFKGNSENVVISDKKFKILLVDDTKVNLIITSKIIGQLLPNVSIFQTDNGEDALKILDDNQDISVVFLDLYMPNMDGYQLIEKIKNSYSNPQKLIAALTVDNSMDGLKKTQLNGFDARISKPVIKQEIIDLLTKFKII
jgi:CheY-like chemotaxis protein